MTQDGTNRIKELEVLKARQEIMTEPFINSPFTYEEDFYTREETAELLDDCAKLPFERQKTRWGLEKRYAVIAYGEVGGRPYNAEVRPLSEAPDAIKKLLAKLSAYSGKNVNYASAVRYVDGTDHMGWHQHREDRGHDATVWIVSTGAERLFGLRDIETKHVFKFTVRPGSLITLSSEANDTHEHAVLTTPGCKSVRYAVNCKAISPHQPQIWDCHAGKKYPADAIYVGREVTDRRGKLIRAASPFGNPYLSPEEFRAYAEEKMKDAAFAAQVMALKGKDLLCWCRPHEADRCHARVWLELANNPKGAASIAAGAEATTTESQSIGAAPNRPAVARGRKAPARKKEKQREISASDATEATTREQVMSKAICIDCVAGLNSLPENSVACVVTSPPYNIGIKYGIHDDNRDDYLEWMQSVFVGIKRVLADDGHFFLQVGGIPTNPLIYERVLRQALAAGFVVQNAIVWVKSIAIDDVTYGHFKPVNSKRFDNNTHEFIFHLTKTGVVPLIGLSPFLEDTLCFIPYVTANKIKDRPKHPAMFPLALPERCIKLSGVPKGSLVVDPFVGSGTTLIACENLGMEGLGFDIDSAYVESANRRLERPNRERGIAISGDRIEEAAEDGSQPNVRGDVCFSLEA
jgi:site-specific DNA-methyltransferase (adenine-specific)